MSRQVWLTSDTHWGHEKILVFEPKRLQLGATIQEHDETLIKRLLSKMKSGDILYHLGDVGLCHPGYLRAILKRFTDAGITIILVQGNHDKGTVRQFFSYGFACVCRSMTMKICKQEVLLCHHPYRWPWWKRLLYGSKSDTHKRPKDQGKWLIHGHIHSNGHHDGMAWNVNGRQINVGVDANDYWPVPLSQIENIIQRGEQK